jgi:hypothetical protein
MPIPDEKPQPPAQPAPAGADEAPDFERPKPDGFAEAMLSLVEPGREDAVWTILERIHRRRGFRSSATWLLVLAAGLAGMFMVLKAYSVAVPGILMYFGGAFILWFINLLPQVRFAHFLRRSDLGDHLLLLPLPEEAYAGAFTRLFIAACLQISLAHLTFWFMLFAFMEDFRFLDTDFLEFFFWAHTGVIGAVWALYWVAIAGGWWWVLPPAYWITVVYNESLPWDQQPIQREETMLKLSFVIFWFVGTALMFWCKRHYAERLRAKLFP